MAKLIPTTLLLSADKGPEGKKSPPQRDRRKHIQEMLTLLKGEATRSSIAMRTDLSAELPKVMVDRVQLQQVFEVADVREAPAIRRGIAHRLRGEVVSCRVTKQFGADTVKVATGLRQAFEGIQKALPCGVQLRIVYDQSQLVSSALGGVTRAILIGAFLVIIVLLVLLGDWRAALIVTLTLPLSILLAGLFARWKQLILDSQP